MGHKSRITPASDMPRPSPASVYPKFSRELQEGEIY